jgi:hypothetical protein
VPRNPAYQRRLRAYLKQVMLRIYAREPREFALIHSKWGLVKTAIDAEIDKLARAGLTTPYRIHQSLIYQNFVKEVRYQEALFSRSAAATIAKEQAVFVDYGWAVGVRGAGWEARTLPTKAIINMIGHTQAGSPLYDIMARDFPLDIERLTNILIRQTALGRNPIETARLMSKSSDAPYWRSLRIARTEQLNVFREAERGGMKSVGIEEWERVEQDDCCSDCAPLDGQIFDVDQDFEAHPNCRGACLPVLP